MQSNRALKRWYLKISDEFFRPDYEMPDNVCVRWLIKPDDLPSDAYAGCNPLDSGRHSFEIILRKEYEETPRSKNARPTTNEIARLVHEMIHVATDCADDHDDKFQAVLRMLQRKGIFEKGAIIKGLTIF